MQQWKDKDKKQPKPTDDGNPVPPVPEENGIIVKNNIDGKASSCYLNKGRYEKH